MKSSILLISNSYVNGSGYLAHYAEQIKELLTRIPLLLFVPYAADKSEWDANTQKARVFFNDLGVAVLGVHQLPDDRLLTELKATKAIFIDGENTFQLLKELQLRNLIPAIRTAVLSGEMRYIGAGAGTTIACKTIRDTNDMDVFYPNNGFEGVNLFPYYINVTPISQDNEHEIATGINDFHQLNSKPVIGMREGSCLSLNIDFAETGKMSLGSRAGVKVFFRDKEPVEVAHSKEFILSDKAINEF